MKCRIGSEETEATCDVFYAEDIIARHQRTCTECRGKIKVGDSYRKEKMTLDDDSIYIARTCKHCISVRDALFCSWTYENMWSELFEEFEYDVPPSSAALAEMTEKGRNKVFEVWEDAEKTNT